MQGAGGVGVEPGVVGGAWSGRYIEKENALWKTVQLFGAFPPVDIPQRKPEPSLSQRFGITTWLGWRFCASDPVCSPVCVVNFWKGVCWIVVFLVFGGGELSVAPN